MPTYTKRCPKCGKPINCFEFERHTHSHRHRHRHTHIWRNDPIGAFLDALEKRMRKITINFVMSVRPKGTTRPPTDGLT